MDSELYNILNENGYGEIEFGGHHPHKITTTASGHVIEDMSFTFNDWFSAEDIRAIVEENAKRRLSNVEVTLTENEGN
jgi:hypothetical protein